MENRTSTLKNVVKRDGRILPYDRSKIISAIIRSFEAEKTPYTDASITELLLWVENQLTLHPQKMPAVEEIQDYVELALQTKGHYSVAKAYILFRNQRSRTREMKSDLMRIYERITFEDAKNDDLKRENANVDGNTAMGTMLKYGSEGVKDFTKLFVLHPDHASAHEDGLIHIHDMDFYNFTTTCTQIDLIRLFKDGFSTGHGYLREPQDILSYSALACIAIQSNQNDQHGGQSIPNFDYAMAEGVRKTYAKQYNQNLEKALTLLSLSYDVQALKKEMLHLDGQGIQNQMNHADAFEEALKQHFRRSGMNQELLGRALSFARKEAILETDRKTYQAMEAFIHNLNTMNSRAGAQVPFSSINYGTDRSPEGRMVMKNLLLSLKRGLGNGETPIFPIHIFRVKDGINLNPEDANYDLFELATEVSAKRLFPNFSFQDAPFNLKYYRENDPESEISYMGCRTRVLSNITDTSLETPYGRGNLSFTSINLPRLAILSKGSKEDFFKRLDQTLDLVVSQLLDRFSIQAAKKAKNFPFLMGQGVWRGSEGLSPEDDLGEVLRHGTLSAGFIGLAEALVSLTGSHHGEDSSARELGLGIVSHMRERMDLESLKRNLNFSLIASPAEGLSGRFVALDRKKFGMIPGVTDKAYYTNSFHVPVYFPITSFEKINIESPYHELTNAGHITYVELDGDASKNPKAFLKIIRHMHKSGIGYGSINHPVDFDLVCGYQGIIGDTCPGCGRNEEEHPFTRIRRITGYLVGSLDRFNNAKLSEVRDRVVHGKGHIHD
ncbi:anaerobic ribonucleoside triphosphate reductase [Proteiniclasticum sp. SCR006]|uniref:Anaerobic ribonucleoside triphosphate reductase n=1 Tax=Proteiniclasticum aestuarii TaxID=2817862 RepID=A0A939H8H4_9CLOT|nr:anaerobic ribonucleoside triphosphate reductase [Proteiniclasticum aestuarii]MBO1263928.1 anaerobic ribonucleoside triphosphate reductase [Proteiniclasticum aestuarii]